MKRFVNLHFMIALHLALIAVFIVGATWYAHEAKSEVRAMIQENIERQSKVMNEIAEITDRNGADETISKIVADCPRRSDFESLLIKLGTLSKKELIEAQQLFESCGGFYAERKALMVSRFAREFEVYKDNVELLESLDDSADLSKSVQSWTEIISLEEERSNLLTEQTKIQQNIINSLLSGQKVNSKDVGDAVRYAQKIAESLDVIDKQIDGIRSALKS